MFKRNNQNILREKKEIRDVKKNDDVLRPSVRKTRGDLRSSVCNKKPNVRKRSVYLMMMYR
jgi:hypothetical protein